jgi:hypothetical protein
MQNSLYVHYKNKYPDGQVHMSESSLDVYSKSGEHVVAMRKNGANQMVCVSEELGLRDCHDLAPIPKDSRLFKIKDGKVSKDEMHDERKKLVGDYLCPMKKDVVLSCDALEKKHGHKFDEKQKLVSKPESKKA